ncbi:hypothetical protein GBF38_007961, partial [Nibea albiflora]
MPNRITIQSTDPESVKRGREEQRGGKLSGFHQEVCFGLAPENTMMSFNRSIACGVAAFETDVQLSPDIENDTEDTVNTILSSDIDPRLVLWLPPGKREYVKKNAPGFIQVYENSSALKQNNGSYLNVKYSKLKMNEIRSNKEKLCATLRETLKQQTCKSKKNLDQTREENKALRNKIEKLD